MASPYFASLDLGRHGLRWLWPEVDLAHPLDDGRAGLAARDLTITDGSLGEDAARWRRLFAAPVRNFDDLIARGAATRRCTSRGTRSRWAGSA